MGTDTKVIVFDVGGVLAESQGEKGLAQWITVPAEAERHLTIRTYWRVDR